MRDSTGGEFMSQPVRMNTPSPTATGAVIDFGMTAQQFRDRLLEKNTHLFAGALLERNFGWPDLDHVLNVMEPIQPMLQIFKDGMVPEEVYTEPAIELGLQHRRLNKDSLAKLMRTGATAVINRMEIASVAARRLCLEVSRFSGHQTIGNGYFTLGGTGTFGKHWDTHDVFAIQLMGRKRWRVFAPTFPYPLSTHTSQEVQNTAPSTPVLDCVLEADDVLYIPRGWWHQAIPLDDASFHLSVGVYVPTMLEYAVWACQRYLPAEVIARKGLSTAQLSELAKDLTSLAQAVTAAIANPSHVAEFKRSLAELQKPPSAVDLALLLDIGTPELGDDTIVTLNHSYPLDCSANEVAVNGVAITLNEASRPIVKALSARSSLTFAELCEASSPVPHERVKALVLEFARMDVVSVARKHPPPNPPPLRGGGDRSGAR